MYMQRSESGAIFFFGLPKNSHLHAPAFAIKQQKKERQKKKKADWHLH